MVADEFVSYYLKILTFGVSIWKKKQNIRLKTITLSNVSGLEYASNGKLKTIESHCNFKIFV